jgi:hypothetical protein
MNQMLPPLPIYLTRSFLAACLLVLTVVLEMFGLSLGATLAQFPIFGDGSPDAILDGIDRIIQIGLAFWMYRERMAPNFRLVWKMPS